MYDFLGLRKALFKWNLSVFWLSQYVKININSVNEDVVRFMLLKPSKNYSLHLIVRLNTVCIILWTFLQIYL